MNFREAMIPYFDEDGLVLEKPNSSPGPDTGNGIENLSIYMILLSLTNDIRQSDVEKFCSVIKSCQVSSYKNNYPPVPIVGLYNRGPRKPDDLIGHDDYVVLSGVSAIVSPQFAKDIAQCGTERSWNFNNVDPDKWTWKSWEGRFVYLIPYWKINGGMNAGFMGRFILTEYLQWANGDATNRTQQWIMCRSLMGRAMQFDYAVSKWRRNMFKDYPCGMQSVFSERYNPTHPFAKYSPIF